MKKQTICFLLSIHFLAGAILFPLGDFSLMKQLPKMYTAYLRIASPDEAGFADFIGDYLLGGKDLLGHNKKDLPGKMGMNIQFQSASAFAAVISHQRHSTILSFTKTSTRLMVFNNHQKIAGYTSPLLRPPLA